MKNCALCLEKEANDTGSHIVPHFLLKRIFNVANAKGRDQELSFKLTAYDVETHFGRGVNPDKLDEVFGELTDEELEEKAIAQMVVDNEWCTLCEKKFAILESAYAETLKTNSEEIYQSTDHASMAFMFWLSIFWRASITANAGFSLKSNDQKTARILLHDYDPTSANEGFAGKHEHALSNVSYKVYRCPEYSKKRGTFLYMAHQTQPYSFLVDEFVIQMYFQAKHMKNSSQLFFGFEKINDAPFNSFSQGESVRGLSEGAFGSTMVNFVEFYRTIRLKVYDNLLNKVHNKFGLRGTIVSAIKDEILGQVTADTTKLGRKYTMEDFVKCTITVLKKYGLNP
ncbi:hypothetical protein DHW03_15330 [Pedobacter yonginense]|uniref:Uncharacterized protein n=1 Tax=Pedobacter yonginense TaxID=651869 RepID=A0A317ELK5_9SPHI|nr:hypothetical protein [Pedobacter yonginense]PWS26166.1 hypothetical protein DHW03_15330 [Pedobacter yonginense]